MRKDNLVVYIVEDDSSVRDALSLFLSMKGFAVALYADAESFLNAFQTDWVGCLLADIRMPGMSGLDLQREMLRLGHTLPIVIMTGHGDSDAAREAFRSNAVDFLEKPLDHGKLLDALADAFHRQEALLNGNNLQEGANRLLKLLTAREKEVLDLVAERKHNREIADLLQISVRTVEVHRSRIMTKLRANGISEVSRLRITNES